MSHISDQAGKASGNPRWLGFELGRLKAVGLVLGVALILAANFGLRKSLEHTPLPHYPVFPNDHVPMTWKLLLPVDLGAAWPEPYNKPSYHWFTTGLTVVKLLEKSLSPNRVYYLLNAALIFSSFACTWFMFRSAVFSFTVTLCMAFSTQFQWLYICSSIVAFYLFVIYLQANLLCLLKVIQTGERRWQVAYSVSLIVLALSHEQWLDYLAFLTLGSLFLLLYAWRAQVPNLKGRAVFVLLASWGIAIVYLAVRLSYGRQQYRPGDESEMIFAYRGTPILAIEDFLSNVMTYLYLAISNYFPPCLVSSNSLYYYGKDRIIAEQHGYHAEKGYLVGEHHLFYWYFWAGIVFAIFAYFLVRNSKAALQQRSAPHVHLTLAMLLILCGFAVHALVKYRPYLSVPLLTYKCMTSNVGVAYLFGYCLMFAREKLPLRRWLYPAIIAVLWGVIIYGGLTRPRYLSHLSEQVGMSPLPDPCRNLTP